METGGAGGGGGAAAGAGGGGDSGTRCGGGGGGGCGGCPWWLLLPLRSLLLLAIPLLRLLLQRCMLPHISFHMKCEVRKWVFYTINKDPCQVSHRMYHHPRCWP